MATRPPRILRVITRLVVSGPSTHVVLADRGLRERGWETLLVHGTVEPDEAEIDLSDVGIPMRRLPSMRRPIRPAADAHAFAWLARVMRAYRPDIVHTHQSKAGLLTRSAAMLTAPDVRRVHTFHGTVFEGYFGSRSSRAIARAERWLGHRTDRIIALSELQRDELIGYRIAPPERITVVPLGLDLGRFRDVDRDAARRTLGVGVYEQVVVWLGRLAPIKRVDRLIDAFATTRRERPEARLYIVGDGALRPELEDRVERIGLAEGVRFVGWSSDAPSWYGAADVVALTSDREGTPLSLIEAGAAGRAVVATDVGGVRDVVADGVTGLLVPAHDTIGLATAMTRLLGEPAVRDAMGQAGAAAASRFAEGRLVDDLERNYREVLAQLPRRNGFAR